MYCVSVLTVRWMLLLPAPPPLFVHCGLVDSMLPSCRCGCLLCLSPGPFPVQHASAVSQAKAQCLAELSGREAAIREARREATDEAGRIAQRLAELRGGVR